MHLKPLFKPLTHLLARAKKSQQIKLKLSKKNVLKELTKEQGNQGENSFQEKAKSEQTLLHETRKFRFNIYPQNFRMKCVDGKGDLVQRV